MNRLETLCRHGAWLASFSIALSSAAYARRDCTAPPSDMVAWWTGDDCTAEDLLGNHDGIPNGFPVCPSEFKVGGGAMGNFGPGTFFSVPDAPALNPPGGDLSVDLWFRPETVPAGTLVSKTGLTGSMWVIRLDATGTVELLACAPSLCIVVTSTGPTASAGTWQFVGFTVEEDAGAGETTFTLYNEGMVDTATFTMASPANNTTGGDLLIGAGFGDGFEGQLDEIEIFGRTLAVSELEGIYLADSAGKCKTSCTAPPPDMVAWWTADDCTANDFIGGHNGVPSGFPVCPIQYKVGCGAMGNFGPGTFFTVPDAPDLNFPGGEMSLDLWFRPETSSPGTLVSKDAGGTGAWAIAVGSSGEIIVLLCDTSACYSRTSTGPVISVGNWQFVGLTIEPDGGSGDTVVTIYNNGVADTWTIAMGSPTNTVGGDLLIGAGFTTGFEGQLDEIELFSRALATSELEAIFLADSAGKCRSTPPFSFCWGDGSASPCPCGNTGILGQGCANSTGSGAVLGSTGSTSVSASDLGFTGQTLLPGQPALLFAGDNAVNGGMGIAFGDGLRCAGGGVVRLGVRVPDAAGAVQWEPGTGSQNWFPGNVRRFQIWYRNPGGSPCGSNFNLSNGLEILFTP